MRMAGSNGFGRPWRLCGILAFHARYRFVCFLACRTALWASLSFRNSSLLHGCQPHRPWCAAVWDIAVICDAFRCVSLTRKRVSQLRERRWSWPSQHIILLLREGYEEGCGGCRSVVLWLWLWSDYSGLVLWRSRSRFSYFGAYR